MAWRTRDIRCCFLLAPTAGCHTPDHVAPLTTCRHAGYIRCGDAHVRIVVWQPTPPSLASASLLLEPRVAAVLEATRDVIENFFRTSSSLSDAVDLLAAHMTATKVRHAHTWAAANRVRSACRRHSDAPSPTWSKKVLRCSRTSSLMPTRSRGLMLVFAGSTCVAHLHRFADGVAAATHRRTWAAVGRRCGTKTTLPCRRPSHACRVSH